jgi:ribosomal protein S18 acetylase RimI-like enzyme
VLLGRASGTPHRVLIRPRRSEDVPHLVTLLREVHERDGFPSRCPQQPEAWIAPGGGSAAWVAVDRAKGEVVGHCAIVPVDPERSTSAVWEHAAGLPAARLSCLTKLFVGCSSRGNGAGTTLLHAALAHTRAAGQRPVLEVSSADQPAVGLYRRTGWREAGAGPRHDWLPAGAVSLLFVAPALEVVADQG